MVKSISAPRLKFFADFIAKETGIIYSEENAYQLENRLIEVSKSLDLGGVDALHAKALGTGISGHFKQLLLDAATNNETSFFRDPKIFAAFEKYMIPQILGSAPAPTQIRIWSVASSFGQEPYSLSMIIQEILERKAGPLPAVEIFTTDICSRALDRVKAAKYSQLEVQRGLPVKLLIKYFEKTQDDYWQLKPLIKSRVSTARMNLLDVVGVGMPFDVIFCRNVLIYQADEKKREIIASLSKFLKPGGFFVLGAAESMIGLSDQYRQLIHEGAVFYQRQG